MRARTRTPPLRACAGAPRPPLRSQLGGRPRQRHGVQRRRALARARDDGGAPPPALPPTPEHGPHHGETAGSSARLNRFRNSRNAPARSTALPAAYGARPEPPNPARARAAAGHGAAQGGALACGHPGRRHAGPPPCRLPPPPGEGRGRPPSMAGGLGAGPAHRALSCAFAHCVLSASGVDVSSAGRGHHGHVLDLQRARLHQGRAEAEREPARQRERRRRRRGALPPLSPVVQMRTLQQMMVASSTPGRMDADMAQSSPAAKRARACRSRALCRAFAHVRRCWARACSRSWSRTRSWWGPRFAKTEKTTRSLPKPPCS